MTNPEQENLNLSRCCNFEINGMNDFIKFLNYLTRNKLSPDTMNVIRSDFPANRSDVS